MGRHESVGLNIYSRAVSSAEAYPLTSTAGLAVLNQCCDLVMRITSHQTLRVLLPGSRRRQAHLAVYLPYGRLQLHCYAAA